MGICASSNLTKQGVRMVNSPTTAKVIHPNGIHQDLQHPIKASHVLSENPGYFLCCSESMYVNSIATRVSHDEELQLGQIYFLLPISKSDVPLSLQDLCALAIKAATGVPLLSDKVQGSFGIPVNPINFSVAHGSWETNRAVI